MKETPLNGSDLEHIIDYLDSLKFNLLTKEIDIHRKFILDKKKLCFCTRFTSHNLSELRNDLFPEDCDIAVLMFTKSNNYNLYKSFIMGTYVTKMTVNASEEWKLDNYKKDEVYARNCIKLSEEFIKLVSKKEHKVYVEMDGKIPFINHFPSLLHMYSSTYGEYLVYIGTCMILDYEHLDDLNKSSLKEEIIKFHEIFKNNK